MPPYSSDASPHELPTMNHGDELEARGFVEEMRCGDRICNPTNAQLIARAVQLGDLRVAMWLIEHGARMDGVDPTHENPAKARKHDRRSALEWSCFEGHVELCQWLLDSGGLEVSDVRAMRAAMGKRPFHLACAGGHTDVLDWLYTVGQSADLLQDQDQAGNTPLHWACCYHHVDAAAWLIARTPVDKLTRTNKLGFTPMAFACSAGAGYRICQMLVRKGGAAVLQSEKVKTQMLEPARRKLGVWAGEILHAHDQFTRTVLFGMSKHSGSPWLSALQAEVELRRLVAAFVGVEHDGATVANLRAVTPLLRPPAPRRSVFTGMPLADEHADDPRQLVPQCTGVPQCACVVS